MKIFNSIAILAITAIMSGCYSGMENFFSSYDIQSPALNSTYTEADMPAFEMRIVMPADKTSTKVYFNGGNISECFDFSSSPAVATYATCEAMWDYVHDGENTLSVDPESIFGGSTRTFSINMIGPTTSIYNVCYENSGDCSLSSSGNVSFDIRFISPVSVVDNFVTVTGGTVYYPSATNDGVASYTLPVSDYYTFTSEDSNGHVSSHRYQRDGMLIEDIVNVRVDEHMLLEVKDLVAKGMSGMDSADPLNGAGLSGPIGTTIYINHMTTGAADLQDIFITDEAGTDADLGIKLVMEPIGSYVIDGSVDNIDDVGMYINMTIKLPWYLFGINITMPMWVEKTVVTAKVDLSIDGNSNIQLVLGQLDGVDVLKLKDISSTGDTGGIDVIGWLVEQPFLRGIILTMVQDVMNRNLETAEFGMDFTPVQEGLDSEMKLELFPKNVYVTNNHTDNVGDMIIGMRGSVTTVTQAANIAPALGSYSVQDPLPIEDFSVNSLTSMSTAVNTNMINQALLGLYNMGVTHMTVMGSEVILGSEVTDTQGEDGDIRVALMPSGPGEFHMIQRVDGASRAYLDYRNAEAYVQYKDAGAWKDMAHANVSIRAGVAMYVERGYLFMRMASTPQLSVHEMSDIHYVKSGSNDGGNITFDVDVQMDGDTVAEFIKSAIYYFVPTLTDNPLRIDISKVIKEVDVYTEEIDTSTGHMTFEQMVGNRAQLDTDKVPVAIITTSSTVIEMDDVVTLDGSGSSDPQGDILRFEWSQISGPTVVFTGQGSDSITYIAPYSGYTKQIVFELEVFDTGELYGTDTNTVTVNPQPMRYIVQNGNGCVTATGGSNSNKINFAACNGSESQQWEIDGINDSMRSVQYNNMCIDSDGDWKVWSCSSSYNANQDMNFVDQGSGEYRVYSTAKHGPWPGYIYRMKDGSGDDMGWGITGGINFKFIRIDDGLVINPNGL